MFTKHCSLRSYLMGLQTKKSCSLMLAFGKPFKAALTAQSRVQNVAFHNGFQAQSRVDTQHLSKGLLCRSKKYLYINLLSIFVNSGEF